MASTKKAKIFGLKGRPGKDATIFTPEITEDGTLIWSNEDGLPCPPPFNIKGDPATDEQVNSAVSTWLTDHPEATTTVEDGAISTAKLADKAVTVDKMGVMVDSVSYVVNTNYKIRDLIGETGEKTTALYFVGSNTWDQQERCNAHLRITQGWVGAFIPDTSKFPFLSITSESLGHYKIDGVRYECFKRTFSMVAGQEDAYATFKSQLGGGNEDSVQITAFYTGCTITKLSTDFKDDLWTEDFIRNGFTTPVTIAPEFVELIKRTVAVAETETPGQGALATLNGKKWIAIGDSYTAALAGGGEFSSMASDLGMTILNHGIVSSTIRDRTSNSGYAYAPMVCRVCNTDTLDTSGQTLGITNVPLTETDVGLITFMGGQNDSWGEESSLGTEIWDMNTTHIYGACHAIFKQLMTSYPNATLVVILQPPGASETFTVDPEGNDTSSMTAEQKAIYRGQKKQQIVKRVAEFYGLPVVDCCFEWYSPANPTHLAKYWQSDKLHMTAAGNAAITGKLKEKLIEIFS